MVAPVVIPAALKIAALTKGLVGTGFGLAAKKSAGLAASAAAKKIAMAAAKKKAAQMAAANAAKGVMRPAGQSLMAKVAQRAGYSPTELALNLVPDIGMNLLYADQIPGDPVDKAIAIGSNIVIGQGLAAGGRAAMNAGRINRTAARANNKVRELAKAGKPIPDRLFQLQDKVGRQQMLPQTMEMGGMMLGGLAAYPVGEHVQKAKSYLGGGGYLSPTDKLFMEQDQEMQAQMLQAYEAGLASGAQGGYYYDPYTGDVPAGGGYGY